MAIWIATVLSVVPSATAPSSVTPNRRAAAPAASGAKPTASHAPSTTKAPSKGKRGRADGIGTTTLPVATALAKADNRAA